MTPKKHEFEHDVKMDVEEVVAVRLRGFLTKKISPGGILAPKNEFTLLVCARSSSVGARHTGA